MCDWHGVAHPQRAGLACHVGVELGVPAIGCAKNLLVGAHGPLIADRGSTAKIVDKDVVIGAVLRTQTNVNPVFVSPGHLVDVESSVRVVLDLARDALKTLISEISADEGCSSSVQTIIVLLLRIFRLSLSQLLTFFWVSARSLDGSLNKPANRLADFIS